MSDSSIKIAAPDIPIIDLSLPDVDLLSIVNRACLTHGFLLVQNHGVNQSLIKQTFDMSKRFFELDSSIKQSYSVQNQPVNQSQSVKEQADSSHFGYTAPFDEKLDSINQKTGNTQEGFYVGRINQSNQFPDRELPEFRTITQLYHSEMTRLSMRLVDLIWSSIHSNPHLSNQLINESTNESTNQSINQSVNQSIDDRVERSHWRQYFDEPSVILRLLHYLPQMPSSIEDGLMGSGSHSDWDFCTILATESAADDNLSINHSLVDRSGERGLQILQDGQWFDVPIVPGTFIVNIADMLQRWTNDVYKSTVHRVVIQSTSDRYSIPFFFGPNSNTMVKVLASCVSDERPIRYEPVCSGEYLQERYRQTQRHRQEQLNSSTNQSVNQSVNQSTNQSNNQSINQSANQESNAIQ